MLDPYGPSDFHVCGFCARRFEYSTRFNLLKHVREHHPEVAHPVVPMQAPAVPVDNIRTQTTAATITAAASTTAAVATPTLGTTTDTVFVSCSLLMETSPAVDAGKFLLLTTLNLGIPPEVKTNGLQQYT